MQEEVSDTAKKFSDIYYIYVYIRYTMYMYICSIHILTGKCELFAKYMTFSMFLVQGFRARAGIVSEIKTK